MTLTQTASLYRIITAASDDTVGRAFDDLVSAGLLVSFNLNESKRQSVWRFAAALPASRIGWGRGGVVLLADCHCQPFIC